jgi:hypothetical protein
MEIVGGDRAGHLQTDRPHLSAWVRFNGNDVAFGCQCNRGDASAKATDDTITFGVPSRNATIPPG